MRIKPLLRGPRFIVQKVNELVRAWNRGPNVRGSKFIRVNQTADGKTVSVNLSALRPRIAGKGGQRKHQHLKNTAEDGGPAFASPFPDSLEEAERLGYDKIVPELKKIG